MILLPSKHSLARGTSLLWVLVSRLVLMLEGTLPMGVVVEEVVLRGVVLVLVVSELLLPIVKKYYILVLCKCEIITAYLRGYPQLSPCRSEG